MSELELQLQSELEFELILVLQSELEFELVMQLVFGLVLELVLELVLKLAMHWLGFELELELARVLRVRAESELKLVQEMNVLMLSGAMKGSGEVRAESV